MKDSVCIPPPSSNIISVPSSFRICKSPFESTYNNDISIRGYRLEAFAQGANADFRFQLIKVQDDGSGKMSLVTVEDIGVDAGNAGDQIIDNLRTAGNNRSNNPAVGSIWGDDTMFVFKMFDFNTFFSSDENKIESSTKNEGFYIQILGEGGGITNVDYIILKLRYSLGV